MAKTNERPKMGDFIKLLPNVATPVQEVRPVATKPEAEEQERISGIWVPKSLAKRLKRHGVDADKTLKEISIEAYEMYLDNYTNK